MKNNFEKIAALDGENKSKVKGYWAPLWGNEYASAITEDYKTDGKKITVKAEKKSR